MIARACSIFSLVLFAAFLPGAAAAQQTLPAAPQEKASQIQLHEDPAVTRRALDWLRRLEFGDIDRAQLDDTLNAKLTTQSIGLMQAELGPFGRPSGIQLVASRKLNGNDAYMYVLTFKAARLQEVIIVSPVGKITGLVFSPFSR